MGEPKMPWTCPACQNTIRQSEGETLPRVGVTYRCSVCRLELVFDPRDAKMTLAPLPIGEDGDAYEVKEATMKSERREAAGDRRIRRSAVALPKRWATARGA